MVLKVLQNLQDHSCVILQYACKKSFPIHKVNQPHRKLATGIRWVFTRKGIATSNIWEAGGLIKSSPSLAYPDIQYHFGPVGIEYNDDKISLLQACSKDILSSLYSIPTGPK